MDKRINQELLQILHELFKDFPEALEFVLAYKEYIHFIDDMVDVKDFQTVENQLKLQSKAAVLYSLPFWRRHVDNLLVLSLIMNNTYLDSVIWEKSEVEWQRRDSFCLRHVGIDMFYAVILITFGRDKLREISLKFREQCHKLQEQDEYSK